MERLGRDAEAEKRGEDRRRTQLVMFCQSKVPPGNQSPTQAKGPGPRESLKVPPVTPTSFAQLQRLWECR
jgi:hypothetical protein